MKKLFPYLLCLAVCVFVMQGCGGSGNGSPSFSVKRATPTPTLTASPTPTPISTPTSTPTPTPTPTPTGTPTGNPFTATYQGSYYIQDGEIGSLSLGIDSNGNISSSSGHNFNTSTSVSISGTVSSGGTAVVTLFEVASRVNYSGTLTVSNGVISGTLTAASANPIQDLTLRLNSNGTAAQYAVSSTGTFTNTLFNGTFTSIAVDSSGVLTATGTTSTSAVTTITNGSVGANGNISGTFTVGGVAYACTGEAAYNESGKLVLFFSNTSIGQITVALT
jgi:hypothetical protein